VPRLANLGLMGIQFPDAYGGAAMSSVDYCVCLEELARVDPSICLSVAAHNGLGAAHIALVGTEAQKQQYLVPLARGERLAAWGLTATGLTRLGSKVEQFELLRDGLEACRSRSHGSEGWTPSDTSGRTTRRTGHLPGATR